MTHSHKPHNAASDRKQALIELTHIGMVWDDKTVLENVSLTVNKGDFLAITGPNGGGKTTLLRIILKLIKPTTGLITYLCDGNICNNLSIGYLPQKNMIDAKFPITVTDVVASGLLGKKDISKQERKQYVEDILKLIELEDHSFKAIGTLSGGQLQRALLGRALISRPEVLVLDEPLSYIDKHFEEHIYKIIENVATNTTILLVSHEMSVISNMANRHIIVDRTLHECTAHQHYFPTQCL